MNNLLLLCLSLSLSGSLVAFTLILLRPILRRFSKTWQYYIWLLVILRLLIPVSLDINFAGRLFQQAETRFSFQEASPMENLPESQQLNLPEPNAFDFKNNATQKLSTTHDIFYSWKNHVLGILWLSAAMVFLFRKVYGYSQLIKAVKSENKIVIDGQLTDTLQTVSAAMGIKKKLSVCMNPLVRAPMLIGIRKPVIVLPDRTISSLELTYIFKHELTHFRRKDFIYKWLVEIAVCLHWFNPLLYRVRKQINSDCEFSCDEAVIAGLDCMERRSYGDTLLNSIDTNYIRRKNIVTLSLNEDASLIKERLCAIMKYKRKSKATVFAAVVLTSFLLCGTVFAGAYTVTAAESIDGENTFGHKIPEGQPIIDPVGKNDKSVQTVVYHDVEIRRYDGEGGHPYIHNTQINNTSQGIVGYQRGMLAFDKDGNPLKIDWWSLDTESDSAYFYLYQSDSAEIAAGDTDDVFGGWSLNLMGNDPAVENIAFVLYCNKEIKFEDGTVWENPDFENWRFNYEGKRVEADYLENYYPFEHKIYING